MFCIYSHGISLWLKINPVLCNLTGLPDELDGLESFSDVLNLLYGLFQFNTFIL